MDTSISYSASVFILAMYCIYVFICFSRVMEVRRRTVRGGPMVVGGLVIRNTSTLSLLSIGRHHDDVLVTRDDGWAVEEGRYSSKTCIL